MIKIMCEISQYDVFIISIIGIIIIPFFAWKFPKNEYVFRLVRKVVMIFSGTLFTVILTTHIMKEMTIISDIMNTVYRTVGVFIRQKYSITKVIFLMHYPMEKELLYYMMMKIIPDMKLMEFGLKAV